MHPDINESFLLFADTLFKLRIYVQEQFMKRYYIKCEPDRVEFFDILKESDEGLHVRIVRIRDGWEKAVEELLPRPIFEMCMRTGHISEAKEQSSSVA